MSAYGHADEALSVLSALEDAGHEAWIVGGAVRDAVMGNEPGDIDIATSAIWQEVARVCQDAGMQARPTGTKHGTVTIVSNDVAFEVTTFRVDSATSADCRHPDSVEFVGSIEEDLKRRDFTMNAMAWHPTRGLVDPFDGQRDIQDKVIRVVGDPKERFREDGLRIIRACRFASQLGFRIDYATYDAMVSQKFLLGKVSQERITHEFDLLLLGDHVKYALMRTVDVLAFIMPELVAMKGCEQITRYHIYDVLEHTAWAVQYSEKTRLARWAALCHDMGKPASAFFDDNGTEHFYGHAKVSAAIAEGLLSRFLMSNAFRDQVVALVRAHSDMHEPTPKSVKRGLAKMGGDVELYRVLLGLMRADTLAHAPSYTDVSDLDEMLEVLQQVIEGEEAFSLRHLAINGDDLITCGFERGPMIGQALDACLAQVIDGNLANERDDLLRFASSIAEGGTVQPWTE